MSVSPVSEFHLRQTIWKKKETYPPEAEPLPVPVFGFIGPYELVAQIAQGGMSIVYQAKDSRTGRPVALKLMRHIPTGSPRMAERFRREAEALAQLRHPHIVTVHEFGFDGDRCYLVMDFLTGGTLNEQLTCCLSDPRYAVKIIEQVSRATHYAHQRGILHRDLKPANVLLDGDGRPVLTDFGLAKFTAFSNDLTSDGELLGTPAYMSPEQAAGRHAEIGVATDIWGLGVMLFELVTGAKPFPVDDRAVMLQAIQHSAPIRPKSLRPALDATLEHIILVCLAKDPVERYPSAAALADDLVRWQQGQPVSRFPTGARASRWGYKCGRRELYLFVIGFTVSGLVAIFRSTNPKPVSESAEIALDRLAHGEAVDLVPENKALPQWHRWPAGETRNFEFEPLSIETSPLTLLELLPRVPVPCYRLRAEMLATSVGLAHIGLYFAYRQVQSDGKPEHLFCALTYNESRENNRLVLSSFRFRERHSGAAGFCHGTELLTLALPSQPFPAFWRHLAVEVSPEKIVVFWEDRRIGEVLWSELQRRSSQLAHLPPQCQEIIALPPSGTVGLCVQGGKGAFRSVMIEPLI